MMNITKEKLYQGYVLEFKTQKELMKEFGIGIKKLKSLMKKYEISSKMREIERKGKTKSMLQIEGRIGESLEDFLNREYVDNMLGSVKISKMLGVADTTIRDWLRRLSFDVKTSRDYALPVGVSKP